MADTTPRKQRGPGRPFSPGVSGNPSGRPPGARNKTTIAALALLEGEAEALTRTAVELAKGGDVTALRLCLERLVPPAKDRHINIALPKMQSAADAVAVLAETLGKVASGELTPSAGQALAELVEIFRRTLEVEELEKRLTALEGKAQR